MVTNDARPPGSRFFLHETQASTAYRGYTVVTGTFFLLPAYCCRYPPHGNGRLGRVLRVPRRAAVVQRARHVPCLHNQHVVPPRAQWGDVQRNGRLLPRRVQLHVSYARSRLWQHGLYKKCPLLHAWDRFSRRVHYKIFTESGLSYFEKALLLVVIDFDRVYIVSG